MYHNRNNIVRYNWTLLAFWHDALRASKCFFLSTQLKGLQNTARARRTYFFFISNQCSKLKDWRSVQILIHKENKNRNIEVVICQVADTLEIGSDWHVDTFWVILVSPLLLLLTYLVTYLLQVISRQRKQESYFLHTVLKATNVSDKILPLTWYRQTIAKLVLEK